MPNVPRVLASQVMQLTGLPIAAAPVPAEITSPFLQTVISQLIRSTAVGLIAAASFSANQPQDALSATVSCILICQSLMRESTTSKQGITASVAANTSAFVRPGPWRSFFSKKAISPSARGWMSAPEIAITSSWRIASVMKPKSGCRTPSMSMTAALVTPIFLPMIFSPAFKRLAKKRSEIS